jgi:hypothetical protein
MAPFRSTPAPIKNINEIDSTLTIDEYKHIWKKSKEYTSTGRSGVHFGHFKASCEVDMLASFDCWIAGLSLKTGYPFQRWHYGMDVMIPKKADSLRVDKLRIIVLMDRIQPNQQNNWEISLG